MKRFTVLFLRLLPLLSAAVSVASCVDPKLEDDRLTERELVTISIRPPSVGEGEGSPAAAGLPTKSTVFAEDDEIADLRILIFRADDGLLAYNQYWADISQPDAQPMTVTLMTGNYHFVFVANEGSDAALSARLDAYTGTKRITDLENESFASAAVADHLPIPMTSVYRNVTVLGDRKLTYHRNDDPGQAFDETDPVMTVNGAVWAVRLERLAVRIDLKFKTEYEQLSRNFTGIEIDRIPNYVRLLKKKADGSLNGNNPGDESGYEAVGRSFAVTDGSPWETEGADHVWTKERIIVPENVFSDRSNAEKSLYIRALYDDGRYVSGTVGLNEPADYSLPRNVLVELTGRLNMPITFEVNVTDWKTRTEVYLPNYHITFRDENGNDIEKLLMIDNDEVREFSVHWAPENAVLRVNYIMDDYSKETGANGGIVFSPADFIRNGEEFYGGYHLYEQVTALPITPENYGWSYSDLAPVYATVAEFQLYDENGAQITDWNGNPLRKEFLFYKRNTAIVKDAKEPLRSTDYYTIRLYSNTWWRIKTVTEKALDGTVLPPGTLLDLNSYNSLEEGFECRDSVGNREQPFSFTVINASVADGTIELLIESPQTPKSFPNMTVTLDIRSKLYAGGTGITSGLLPAITAWAGSNVYWVPSDDLAAYPDGGYLTFDYDPADPAHGGDYRKQGVFFKWGSLIAWGSGTGYDDDVVFVPSEAVEHLGASLSGTPGNYRFYWGGIPTGTNSGLEFKYNDPSTGTDQSYNPIRQRHHLLEHHVPERATGDICKYISDKGWAPDGGNWRMPSSQEFGTTPHNFLTPVGTGITYSETADRRLYGYSTVDGYTILQSGTQPQAIFPASGYVTANGSNAWMQGEGFNGYYWTASAASAANGTAYTMYVIASETIQSVNIAQTLQHVNGASVRCVREN